MDLKTFVDTRTQDLEVRAHVTAIERHNWRDSVLDAVLKRITDELAAALLPEFEAHVRANIDWTRITRGVEDAMIAATARALGVTK